jgi:hypothetical protein
VKGKILGCDSSGCVINGEDGDRYLFQLADWKGARSPQAKDDVDFVAAGNKATDVYLVATSPAFSVDTINTDAGRKALDFLRDRPQVVLAAIILIATVFLNFVQINSISSVPPWHSTAIGIPGKVATIRTAASDSIRAAEAALSNADSSNFIGTLAVASMGGNTQQVRSKIDDTKAALAASQLVVLIYLIPAGAAFILFLEYRKSRNRLAELGTGAMALICIIAALFAREVAARYLSQSIGTGAESFKQAFQLGLGGWLIGLSGVGLIATGLGILRRTPGIPN